MMAQAFGSLSVFRLDDKLVKSNKFEDFIDPDKTVEAFELKGTYDFEAKLFVTSPDKGAPSWLPPLEKGFGKLSAVPESVSTNAVMILRVGTAGHHKHFAFSFGFGRFLLRPGSYRRNYGLRVALNAIYGGGKPRDLGRIRSVDSRTVTANTVRTRRQVDRSADFESFDVDIERDFLSGLTGKPLNEGLWGNRINGADSVHITKSVEFHQLGELCRQIERHSQRIPTEFGWVDKIFAIRDTLLIENLRERVLEMIQQENVGDLELAPPALVEWGNIVDFAFSFDSEQHFYELSIETYLASLREKGKLESLSLNQLMSGHRLLAFNANGNQEESWSIFRSLSCEIEYHRKTYVLSEGEFFEVAKDYLGDLNRSIGRLEEYDRELSPYNPDHESDYAESDYNEALTASSPSYLLLDRETVIMTSRTTPIEICDVLSTRRDLIHVKRKLNSSSLSHLFAQGLVSADLLLTSNEFRQAAKKKISKLEADRDMTGRFSRLIPIERGITASEFTVVYAIVARWKKRSLASALPFFSKVNLRRYVRDLKRMGYQVSYKKISDNLEDQ